MISEAINKLVALGFKPTLVGSFDHEEVAAELHELLNEECVSFKTMCDQDTWIFTDGSYVTRIDDDYYPGDDIDQFLIF